MGETIRKTDSPDTVSDMLFHMAQPSKLSPAQAAEILGLQTRTLRRWSNIFAVALSPSASVKGKKRFFSGQDISTLRRAMAMRERGMSLADIAAVLPIVPADENEATSLTLSTEQSMILGTVVERARALSDEMDSQDDRIAKLEEWAKQSWYRKLFTKPE